MWFNVSGQQQISRNLRVAATSIPKMSEFFSEALDIVEKRTNDVFSSGGRILQKNPTRRPLAASTLKARDRRRWYYKKTPNRPWTLRRTWDLQEKKRKEITDKYWSLAYTQRYAGYHQDGGARLPKRAIIDIDNGTGSELVRALQRKINKDLWIFGKQL